MRKTMLTGLVVAVLLFAAIPASAHAHATVVEANGNRCYILTQAISQDVEFWIETNGVLTGGEAMGPPSEAGPIGGIPFWDLFELLFNVVGVKPGDFHEALKDSESGLQRGSFDGVPPDTKVTEDEWVQHCLL